MGHHRNISALVHTPALTFTPPTTQKRPERNDTLFVSQVWRRHFGREQNMR